MREKLKIYLLALGIVAVLIGLVILMGENTVREDTLDKENFSCQIDEDCVKVDAGCCGCNEGGEAVAIHEDRKSSWEAQLQENCTNVACIQMISNHSSCKKEAVCENGICVLK